MTLVQPSGIDAFLHNLELYTGAIDASDSVSSLVQ